MNNKIVLLLAGAAALAVAGPGCGTQASTICGLACDCEHCSNIEEDVTCAAAERQADRAEAYGCSKQWDAWATCVEDKGVCDEKEARFSTQDESRGSCTGMQTLGLDCSMNPMACTAAQPNAFCDAGQCKYKTCSGGGQACTTDSECPTSQGKDKCADQQSDVSKCIEDNTAHKTQQQPPQPGDTTGAGGGQ